MKLPFMNIIKANAEIKALSEKVQELETFNTQLKGENETLKQREATFSIGAQDWGTEKEELIKSHEEAIKQIQAEHAKEIENLKTTVKEVSVSAGEQAAQIVASLGVSPDTVKVVATDVITSGKGFKVIDHLKK